tara:strand:- start:7521 stop:9503 length:1983 start_codon:yes stop_codon:yes gene_type:complete
MTEQYKKLTILETFEELKKFNSYYKDIKNKDEMLIVSPSPDIRNQLKENDISSVSSLSFDSNKDHFEGAKYIDLLTSTVNERYKSYSYKDSFGVTDSYRISIQYRLQYFAAHLTQLIQLYLNILRENKGINEVYFFGTLDRTECSDLLSSEESFHYDILKKVSELTGIKILQFNKKILLKNKKTNKVSSVKLGMMKFCSLILSKLVSFQLSLIPKNVLLITDTSNRIGVLADEVVANRKDIKLGFLYGLGAISDRGRLTFKKLIFEICISLYLLILTFLKIKIKVRGIAFHTVLNFKSHFLSERVNFELSDTDFNLSNRVDYTGDEFFFRKIYIGDLIKYKMDYGIIPFVKKMISSTALLDKLLAPEKIHGLLSPLSLDAASTVGELCRIKNIRGLLASHGSHPVPHDERLIQEYKRHGEALIDTKYPFVAIQSKVASEYIDFFNISSVPVISGPLCWGVKHNLNENVLEEIGVPEGTKVIVHAGSQKSRSSYYFGRYETSDEYLNGILDLVEAVKGKRNISLIIKFRAGETLSLETLKREVPDLKNVFICVDQHFLDIIAKADLLVSYSSTTIEEALGSLCPVLHYGADGRLVFLRSQLVTRDSMLSRGATYFVDKKENLSFGIDLILGLFEREKLKNEEIEEFIIKKENRISLTSFFS